MSFNRRNFIKSTVAMGAMAALPQFTQAKGTVNFINWAEFIGENNISDFTKASGIKVKESFFGSDGELFAKIMSRKSGFDVAMPTGSYVPRMIAGDLLQQLDLNKLPNLKNLSSAWKNLSIDPTGKYQVPLAWGTAGIGYNSQNVDENDMQDAKYLLDSGKYSGQIAWFDSGSEMFTLAVIYLLNGDYPTKYDAKIIKEAHKLLSKQKKHIKLFHANTGSDLLAAGEVNIAAVYNGAQVAVASEDPSLKYSTPLNCAFRWFSCLAIPKNAPNNDNAHKFINHLLAPKQGLDFAEYTQYAVTNTATLELASAEYKNNPILFPPEQLTAKLTLAPYLGEELENDVSKRWIELKAQ